MRSRLFENIINNKLEENFLSDDRIYVLLDCDKIMEEKFPEMDFSSQYDEEVDKTLNEFFEKGNAALEAAGFEKRFACVGCDPESGPSEHDFDNAQDYFVGTVADLRDAVDNGLDLDGIEVYENVDEGAQDFYDAFSPDDKIEDIESLLWEGDYEPPLRESISKRSVINGLYEYFGEDSLFAEETPNGVEITVGGDYSHLSASAIKEYLENAFYRLHIDPPTIEVEEDEPDPKDRSDYYSCKVSVKF